MLRSLILVSALILAGVGQAGYAAALPLQLSPPRLSPPRLSPLQLAGTKWTSPCYEARDNSAYATVEFSASTVTNTTLNFEGKNCQTAWDSDIEVESYSLGSATPLPGAVSIDMQSQLFYFRTDSQAAADTYSEAKVCGLLNWRVGEARDVTGPLCEGTYNPGELSYTILAVTKDADNREAIQFGEEADGQDTSSPDKRPTRLANTAFYRSK